MPSLREKMLQAVPPAVKRRFLIPVIHQVGASLIDLGTWILNERDPLLPPRRLQGGGTGDFKTGYEFLDHFRRLGGLEPHHSVLDIGCGVGRMAVPLTAYLKGGSYTGVDVNPVRIEWCQQHITEAFPHFRFQTADIYNKTYNPKGRIKASEYVFPFDDGKFDFIFLTSVFTHLVPEDAAHYLKEVSRLLRNGGRLFATWFLLDQTSRALIREERAAQMTSVPYEGRDDVWVKSAEFPEEAIAFGEGRVLDLHASVGLRVDGRIWHGSWCGRADGVSFQDIVVAQKPA